MPTLTKLLSGAQTGADRAALDWAIFHDIPHGGWCPKGRKAEDGVIPPGATVMIIRAGAEPRFPQFWGVHLRPQSP